MSILWIILIVILVLALLGFFSRGYWAPNFLWNRPPGPLPGGLPFAMLAVCGRLCISRTMPRCSLAWAVWLAPTGS